MQRLGLPNHCEIPGKVVGTQLRLAIAADKGFNNSKQWHCQGSMPQARNVRVPWVDTLRDLKGSY